MNTLNIFTNWDYDDLMTNVEQDFRPRWMRNSSIYKKKLMVGMHKVLKLWQLFSFYL